VQGGGEVIGGEKRISLKKRMIDIKYIKEGRQPRPGKRRVLQAGISTT